MTPTYVNGRYEISYFNILSDVSSKSNKNNYIYANPKVFQVRIDVTETRLLMPS